MKFFTLGCTCGCTDSLLGSDEHGNEFIPVLRSKQQAEIVIADSDYEGDAPVVIEIGP
jgi:hypothetical protein